MQIGIESLAFYTSHYFLDLALLAKARDVPVDKFYTGLGQQKMAISPPDEDVVTLAANATLEALRGIDKSTISMVLFATESGVDQSKAAGLYVAKLLDLPRTTRIVELKQACYSATAALMLSLSYLKDFPEQKIILIASDIARYGLDTPGEPSQGAGAVVMVLSTTPKLMVFEQESGLYYEEAMDFWRPNYRDAALVDGKFSCELYLKVLEETWEAYQRKSGRAFSDHQQFLFHIPITKLAEKAYQRLCVKVGRAKPDQQELTELLGNSLRYSRIIGNCYTASLHLGLASLLENSVQDLSGQRIGFYSYGSGATGEFFSGKVLPGYQAFLKTSFHQDLLINRQSLDMQGYKAFYEFPYVTDGSEQYIPRHQTGAFRLEAITQHQRIYKALDV